MTGMDKSTTAPAKHCEICERRLSRLATKATVCRNCKEWSWDPKPEETQQETIDRNYHAAFGEGLEPGELTR